MTMNVGRVCVKLVGREAGKRCVIVDVIDDTYVLVDGPEVKRRRCNVAHLEPLNQTMKIRKGASDKSVKEAFESFKEEPLKRKVEEKPPAKEPEVKEGKPEEGKPEEGKPEKKASRKKKENEEKPEEPPEEPAPEAEG